MAALPHRPPLRGPQIGNRLPPSLPPRAGGRAIRPPPTVQPSVDSEIYDDFDESEDFPDQPDDVYDDCGDKPPPLPPLPVAQPEEYYDDFEEEQPRRPPMRPPAKLPPPIQPLPDVPQETYDDLDNVGPVIVQQISKVRPLPSTPAPPPPVQGIVDEVYEDPDASQPAPAQRGPSPPRNPPPGRSWVRIPEPPSSSKLRPTSPGRKASPGRSKSPSQFSERSLPPIPSTTTVTATSKESRARSPIRQQAQLPPIPPLGARAASPMPIPAARNRRKSPEQSESCSPVVVPVKGHPKGGLPPLPSGDQDWDGVVVFSHGDEDSDEDQSFGAELPPWSTNDHSDDIYELNIDEPGMASPPPPPPPPPPPNRTENQGVRRLPPQPRSTPAPAQQASGPGGFSIDMSQLKNLRAGLKKVSVVDSNPAGSSGGGGGNTSPKTYGVCAPSVADAKRKFQEKAEGRPGFLTPKPAIVPKFGATWKAFGATTTTTGANGTPVPPKPVSHTLTPSPKPPLLPPVPADQEEELLNTGVTFLSKVNKDKHTHVPVVSQALPAPVKKLVTRYEPPPPPQEEDYFEDGDIYDDASSGDLLDRYDWYHGILDRKSSEARVKAVGKDGTYLVRVSEKDPRFPYTLVVLNKGHVNNLRIRLRQDGKVAIGDEKPDELTFSDVLNLINHHKTHNVVLLGSNSQSHVALQHTPHKS